MKRLLYLMAVFLMCAGICGCGQKEKNQTPEDGTYRIYYLNSTRTKLASVEYKTETTDQETLIGELAGQILAAPDNPDYQAALGEKVILLDIRKEENVLYLNFNKDYTAMKPTREILCRAALAKTFTQVAGIDYISINCDGQPLLDQQGNPVGAFSASDFVESISDVNSFERVELKLYFANEKKDLLVPETREVIHNVNTSLERLVVEQLIAGSQTGASPVLPKDTRILNVSLTDNICYVNLDSTFLNGEVEAADYIPVYALVNSLTELQTVNKVQITVNGSANVAYRNVISLAAPLEREEKYVESK
ncbi:Sporulation and spore germination [[Clostridium] symbiosum]|uniref:Sporulation and spore germination n=3 Tax=Clostridium symbiosum TaxID=1512 RepID=A0A6N3HIF3_CLOSY